MPYPGFNVTILPFAIIKPIVEELDDPSKYNYCMQKYGLHLSQWPTEATGNQDWQLKLTGRTRMNHLEPHPGIFPRIIWPSIKAKCPSRKDHSKCRCHYWDDGLSYQDNYAFGVLCMIGNVARSKCNSWEDVTEFVLPQVEEYDKDVGGLTKAQLIEAINQIDWANCICTMDIKYKFSIIAKPPLDEGENKKENASILQPRSLQVGCVCVLKGGIKFIIKRVLEIGIIDDDKANNYVERVEKDPTNDTIELFNDLVQKLMDDTTNLNNLNLELQEKVNREEKNKHQIKLLKEHIKFVKAHIEKKKHKSRCKKELNNRISKNVNYKNIKQQVQELDKSINKSDRKSIENSMWKTAIEDYTNQLSIDNLQHYDKYKERIPISWDSERKNKCVESLNKKYEKLIDQQEKERIKKQDKIVELVRQEGKFRLTGGLYKGKLIDNVPNWYLIKQLQNWEQFDTLEFKVYIELRCRGDFKAYQLYCKLKK